MLAEVLILVSSAFAVVYLYLRFNAGYFERKGVPFIPGNSLFGNLSDFVLGRNNPTEMVSNWYNHPAGNNQPFVGIRAFQKNVILVKDPELVKQIMIKDFNIFSTRFSAADIHRDALAAGNLFFANNPEWKMIRRKLTPVFTSGKLKQMFHLIDNVSFISIMFYLFFFKPFFTTGG